MIIKTASLTPAVLNIVQNKGTEPPFCGTYNQFDQAGSYLCRQCGLALFRSQTKFHSGCGWPSFDNAIAGAVQQQLDRDGRRTEILCARCQAHLGHIFHGEGFTEKNCRHCVNSFSLDFVTDLSVQDSQEAIIAAGCFWGVEYYFQRLAGVLKTEVGYSGGQKNNPTYQDICSHSTGHYEAVRIIYDVAKIDYEAILKYFFEIHDFSQKNGQGPDIGEQYLSVIFYYDEQQKNTAQQLVAKLQQQGLPVATQISPVSTFWPAESYHQLYYEKNHKQPYCHTHRPLHW